MTQLDSPGRMVARYRLRCAAYEDARALAAVIAREQTLEVPPGVGGDALEALLLGRVEGVEALPERNFEATISFALELTGTELP